MPAMVSKEIQPPLPPPTYALRMVRCGKAECHACPHGPYWYRWVKKGSRVRWKYVGKTLPASATEAGREEVPPDVETRAQK
jgi:hypothetical protein